MRPQDIRALLGLGPSKEVPTGAALRVGKTGKPAQPKAKRTPGGPAGQRARKPRTLPEPSGGSQGPHTTLASAWCHRRVDGPGWHPRTARRAPESAPMVQPTTDRLRNGAAAGLVALPRGPRQLDRPPPGQPPAGSARGPGPHPGWAGHGP